ncbi:MAG: hypothetical protein J6Y17_00510 [Elusimicrobiaceae bacterium]|nr:hypothetical protein [Elusimicrobiaceae bacterium]
MKKLVVMILVGLLAIPSLMAQTTQKSNSKKGKVEIIIVESGEYDAGKEDPRLTSGLAGYLDMEPVVTKISPMQAMQDPTMSNLDYSFLPLYLLKKTKAVNEKMAPDVQRGIIQETPDYIVLAHQTQMGVYTNPEAKPDLMEVFVMSQCPYGVMAENAIIEAKKRGDFPMDKMVKVRYIVNYDSQNGFSSLHGSAEWEEDVRQLLIAKYYPTKFWQYLAVRNKDYQSSRWDKAMKEVGINPNKIMKKFDTEGLELLKAEAEYGKQYGINASPTFLWEGKVQTDFGGAAQIKGFSFLDPSRALGGGSAAPAPTGSC